MKQWKFRRQAVDSQQFMRRILFSSSSSGNFAATIPNSVFADVLDSLNAVIHLVDVVGSLQVRLPLNDVAAI